MFYAQIKDGEVKAITESQKPITGDGIVEIDSFDTSLLEAAYNGSKFTKKEVIQEPKDGIDDILKRIEVSLEDISKKIDGLAKG